MYRSFLRSQQSRHSSASTFSSLSLAHVNGVTTGLANRRNQITFSSISFDQISESSTSSVHKEYEPRSASQEPPTHRVSTTPPLTSIDPLSSDSQNVKHYGIDEPPIQQNPALLSSGNSNQDSSPNTNLGSGPTADVSKADSTSTEQQLAVRTETTDFTAVMKQFPHLTREYIQQQWDQFILHDKNMDFSLDFDELMTAVTHTLGHTFTESELREAMQEADKDNSNTIDFFEYLLVGDMLKKKNGDMQPYRVEDRSIDDYNPFAQPGSAAAAPTSLFPSQISTATGDAVQQQQRIAELEKRQRELNARAAELNRQEEEHRRRMQLERDIQDSQANFPPLPSCCPCKSCFYQDIDMQIAPPNNHLVRWVFRLWLIYGGVLVLNVIACLVYMVTGNPPSTESYTTFGLSIIFLVIFFPGSYVCWFRPLYNAFRKDSSFNFVLFFVMYWLQIAVNVVQALGINWFASCGFINGLGALTHGTIAAGVIMVMLGVLFSSLALTEVYFVIRIHQVYRTQGGTLLTAQEEVVAGTADFAVRNFGSLSSTGRP